MDLAAYALIALCLYREQLGTDNRRRSSYQDVVRRMQPAYYSADDPAFSGSQMTQDVPEYESGTASQSEADPPSYPVAFPPPEPCAHPADQRYISVAGTENCHVCYQVLSEKRHLVKKDESFDEGCLHPQCIKTRHDDDPNFHEDWLGVFHEGPQKPVGSAGLWGDV